jgi:serine protease Do
MKPFSLSSAMRSRFAAVTVAVAAATAGAGILSLRAAPNPADTAAIAQAKDLSNAFRSVSDSVLPSVVMITNKPAAAMPTAQPGEGMPEMPFGDLFQNPELKRFFKDLPSMPKMPHRHGGGIGSGVIIDPAGIILTNNHVVAGGGTVTVRLHDGREFQAEEVKTDPKTDLAVVRIKADNLPAAKLGDSDQTQIGDWVLALGQPFGLEGTVTAGIISAKGRGIGINDRESYLQTDAAINPGNSGGPLVNLNGEVIGINTAISSSSGGNQGIGFAVPVNMAKWVSNQLVSGGTVHRGQLGVSIQMLTQPLAERFGLKVHEGVLINQVLDGSPAAEAGLKVGDVIVEFAGKAVSDPRELQLAVEQTQPGSEQTLTIIRDGNRMNMAAKVRQGETTEVAAPNSPGEYKLNELGFEVGPLSADSAEQMGMKGALGVVVTSVTEGSRAQDAGLKNGMVVTEVNRTAVKSVEEFRKAMEQEPKEKGCLLLVRTTEGSRFLVLPPRA